MKRILLILLIMLLTLTACGEQETIKTEEELKAEILAELKAEAEANLNNDNESDNESEQQENIETIDKKEELSKRDDVFYANDLLKGAKVSDKLTVDYFESGDMGSESVGYKLISNNFIKGDIFYENNMYFVRFDEDLFDKNVLVGDEFAPNGEEEINLNGSSQFTIDGSQLLLPPEYIDYILEGGIIHGGLYVKEITYESNPMECLLRAVVTEVKMDDNELERLNKEINNLLEKSMPDVYLSGFDYEKLYSEDSPITIDYSRYSLVIVPMQDSKNMDKLEPRIVNVSEEDNFIGIKFSVFGTLHNVSLTHTKNALDDSEVPNEIFIADKIENECVFINADFPTDFSSVMITGNYQYGSGIEEISFSLDSMRDCESYPIYTVDAYSFPNEDY